MFFVIYIYSFLFWHYLTLVRVLVLVFHVEFMGCPPTVHGRSIDCKRTPHGLFKSMDSRSCVHGMRMRRSWTVRRVHSPWGMRGAFVGCTWTGNEASLESPRVVHGQSVGCMYMRYSWGIQGRSVGPPWTGRGASTDSPWRVHRLRSSLDSPCTPRVQSVDRLERCP